MVGVQVNGLGHREDVPFFLRKHEITKGCNSIHLFLMWGTAKCKVLCYSYCRLFGLQLLALACVLDSSQ